MLLAAAVADTLAHAADSAASLAHTLIQAAGAPADSAQAERLAQFREFVERWHDFYLLTGTAAVTLAGLLFIALSLHMEVLVQERCKGMLLVARSALISFVFVLIVSLMMLVPYVKPRVTGVMLIGVSLVFMVQTLLELRGIGTHDHADFTRRTVRRRVLMPIIGFLMIIVAGFGMRVMSYESAFNMIGAMILLLVNAAYASWDLLVRVSRVKAGGRSAAEPPA